MINLTYKLVFSKVLPDRDVTHKVLFAVEPVWADPGEGVAGHAGVGACSEEACQQHKREQDFKGSVKNCSVGVAAC